jgi:hypothetical protein
VALPGQQWDEISTWRENGGNGSWRHAVWGAWLPTSVAAGATYQVEFIVAAGAYSESSHQALTALCSGPAAHDLKIHLTDVRNQDNTLRDSGDATFDVCSNIANAGRDAPQHIRAGNVYDEYIVKGLPVYTSGHSDPLLYMQCPIDIFTKASDGVSPGDVRWMCHIINGWMNVAAGSIGNAGNPGPAGFPKDPQAVSYRLEIDDGASDVLDWSGLDATVNSASNPISPSSSNGCDTGAGNYCMFVSGSTGTNAWYDGMATRVSCGGTCPAGLTNDTLYYVWPSSVSGSNSLAATQYVALASVPWVANSAPNNAYFVMTGAQGTGTTTFSTRVQNYHGQAIQTLDTSGQDNWAPFGTTTRVTRKVYPAFTATEKRYWEESGVIIPLNLTQPLTPLTPTPTAGQSALYQPGGELNVIGGTGTGPRPDLGISNDWAAQAFVNGTQANWDYARLFSLGNSIHGPMLLLNEATGRIPVVNNGPPVGPGGNGVGGSYPSLGAPMNQVNWVGGATGFAVAPTNTPNPPGLDICCGTHSYGTYISHVPNFNGFTYMIFGDRHWLDLMRWRANADYEQQRPGPGPEPGEGYYRDNTAVYAGDGNTYHYYGLMLWCCQNRGAAWMRRDVTYAATFGSDSDIERSYFADFRTETDNYEPAMEAWLDGAGSTAYRNSMNLPDSNGDSVGVEYFIETYEWEAEWLGLVWLHQPMSSRWMTRYQRFQEGCLGGQLAGAPVSYYCVSYTMTPAVHIANYSGGSGQGGNLGPGMNGTDASDFGTGATGNTFGISAGGQLAANVFVMAPGDKVQNLVGWRDGGSRVGITIDQLGPGWYTVIGPTDNTQAFHTFYIQCSSADHAAFPTQCPVAGQAFTGFTSGGTPITGQFGSLVMSARPQYDPGANAGYEDVNYDEYAGQMNNGLQIAGFNVTHAQADFAFRDGGGGYNPASPSFNWDPTVVVPGLPAAVNSVP